MRHQKKQPKGRSLRSSCVKPEEEETRPILREEASFDVRGSRCSTSFTMGCFLCVALSAFLGDASRGLVVPSIVPFIYTTGADSAFVGWVNGVYSAGRLVAAPLFGYWAERRSFREAICVDMVLFVVGTLGLARGYIALSTTKEERTHWMSMLTAAQFAGYSITPGIGALMSFLNVDILGETVEFDAFTTPGYAMVLLGIANIVLLFWMWTEPEKQREKQPDEDDPGRGTLMRCASFVGMGILLYVVLQFFARLAVAVYETISQLMAVGLYNWGIFTFGITACAFGIAGLVVLFLHKPLCKRTSDETVLFGGLAALALGFLTFTPWGGSGESRGVLITQYFIGSVFIFSLGFPVTQALMLSCFSKLLGPIPQSGIMGWMASLGSLARMVGAVLAGGAYQNDYMVALFLCTIGGLLLPSVLLVAWVHIWKRKGVV